ncbi:hypothetical protein [Micromonospora sp. SH-82]|uniref:hypothetical protein n=1 Tax=Micromonospora sp. SH-82 TaxID=3132938 RepID=UPI003EBD4C8D
MNFLTVGVHIFLTSVVPWYDAFPARLELCVGLTGCGVFSPVSELRIHRSRRWDRLPGRDDLQSWRSMTISCSMVRAEGPTGPKHLASSLFDDVDITVQQR